MINIIPNTGVIIPHKSFPAFLTFLDHNSHMVLTGDRPKEKLRVLINGNWYSLWYSDRYPNHYIGGEEFIPVCIRFNRRHSAKKRAMATGTQTH